MKCGLECIEFIEEFYHVNMREEKECLIRNLTNKGINIYGMCESLKKYHASAYRSLLLPVTYPSILYLREGHYIVLINMKNNKCIIYDPKFKIKEINKFMMYLQWSHIYIKIENIN